MQTLIAAERLALRAPRAEDAPRITELLADYDVARNLARVPWPYRQTDAEAFLDHCKARDAGHDALWAIEHPEHGLIGMTGFHTQDGDHLPEIGYWIGRDYWGRGFATEAASAALVWADRDWGKRAVRSGHFVENEASARVLAKLGFLYTGDVIPRPSLARGEDAWTRMMVWLA